MATQDIFHILTWWLVITIIGAIFFPFTSLLFKKFFDKGYIFAKIIGIIIISYLTFLFGILHIFPFSGPLIFSCVGIFLFIPMLATRLIKKMRIPSIKYTFGFLNSNWKIVLLEESLFLGGIFFWAFIRSFEPSVHGLEKYMDFGFINSILRSDYLPPKDMWLTPFSINYYYFGHFVTALLTKLSGIPSNITFNLMLATIFAFCFSASFSLGANIYAALSEKIRNKWKILAAGLLAAILVTFSGNLQAVYTFFQPYENEKPVPPWQLGFSFINPCHQNSSYIKDGKTTPCSPQSQTELFSYPNSYWYPNATRFIHNTIHEFPIYSWVVADLHGHVLDIPFVLLTIAVLFSFFQKFQIPASQRSETNLKFQINTNVKKLFGLGHLKPEIGYLIFIGFLLAVMYMTNAWDGIIYLLLAILIALYLLFSRPVLSGFAKRMKSVLPAFLLACLTLFLGFIIFSLPFSVHFKPFVSGIGVLNAPNFLVEKKIDPGKPIVREKTFAASISGTSHCQYKATDSIYKTKNVTYQASQIGPFLFEPFHCQRSPLWQLLILYGFPAFLVVSYLLFLIRKRNAERADVFVLLLILLSTLLIVLPEFIYVKDIYPDHYRANTMFKLVFQAFIMLSLCGGYIIIRLLSSIHLKKSKDMIFYLIFIFLLIPQFYVVLSYPYFAINAYYNNVVAFRKKTVPEDANQKPEYSPPIPIQIGLDGTEYLKQYPIDYEAIQYIKKNISGQPVILEAQGDSYTDYGRVSVNTGLPTVLGWTVHEWLWRGKYDIEKQPADPKKIYTVPAPRLSEITNLYESADLIETKRLLKKYKIELVFLGDLERQKYPNLNELKWQRFGSVIFQKGNTKIYRIRTKE